MKKITWGLLALLIGQPIIVYIGQAALLTTIPNHYGLLGGNRLYERSVPLFGNV
ncbi:hypothetical protein [Lactiplantibacillus plantarum]|uniref:hypothetical protein n=1 Tax=Lactiplantibacillus plantarum TaxID=1590 RepID=UPI0021A94252|nr:hypothetical protein [Lactiplantibacillus plantarum]